MIAAGHRDARALPGLLVQMPAVEREPGGRLAWGEHLAHHAVRRAGCSRSAPADIESPSRLIELKSFGTSNRGYDLLMEARLVEEARRDPDYYVYVVENVRQGDPAKFTLRVLGARGCSGCWVVPRVRGSGVP
jgi:hypothetical protein